MNYKPLGTARSALLRGSMAAILRAAQRAQELAAQTGTSLIVSRDGLVERIDPVELDRREMAHERSATYAVSPPVGLGGSESMRATERPSEGSGD